jgi:L,D-transpeptidase catalytic domain
LEFDMRGHAVILAAALAWLIPTGSAEAKLDILVDKVTQRMLVIQDGYIRYMWPVSTGRDNMATPNGVYAPQRLERNWFSTAYYSSPMPFSIFFHNGYAIHGSYAIDRLGGPASHGCVRLHPHHAAILFDLVQQEGPGNTRIEITDQGPPEERALPGREIAEAPPREIGAGPPGEIGAGPREIPPVPRVIRYRESGDTPDPIQAQRGNQQIAAKNGLPPPRVASNARRLLAYVKPPASVPRGAAMADTANGSPRPPSQASDARPKPKLEAPRVTEAPKIAEGSSPEPTQPASSSSSLKLLPASCWSGGASRWKWWASGQANPCR